jgi:hypothetical protein
MIETALAFVAAAIETSPRDRENTVRMDGRNFHG